MNGDSELEELERKRKEVLVKKIHKNKILAPTEKYHYYKTRIPGDKQIAKRNYADLIDELYNLYYGAKFEIPTLSEAVEKSITKKYEKETIEYITSVSYRSLFKKYFSHLPISNKLITDISKEQLRDSFETIAGDGSGISKKVLSNIRTVINGAFDYANMIDGIDCIDSNRVKITDLIRKCQPPASEDEAYTRDEAEAIVSYLNTLNPTVYTLAIRLMFCLSVRIGELSAITWNDYDEEKKELHLTHSLVTKPIGTVHRRVTDVNYMKSHSNKGKRVLALSDYAIYLLSELKKINGEKKYILQSKGKMPISTNHFNDHLKAYCKVCGIEYKSSHKIRFYACSMMYEAGYDEKTIQENMGHSSLAMTRHYDRRTKKEVSRELTNSTFGFQLPSGDGKNNSAKP